MRAEIESGRIRGWGCYDLGITYRGHWGSTLEETTDGVGGIGHGNNAGFVALNLAYVLGGNPIYMLGFDCYGKNGFPAHWWDDYVDTSRSTVDHYDMFIKCFDEHIPEEVKPRFINTNPESALKTFKKVPLEEV